jgi:hypothetical protein
MLQALEVWFEGVVLVFKLGSASQHYEDKFLPIAYPFNHTIRISFFFLSFIDLLLSFSAPD